MNPVTVLVATFGAMVEIVRTPAPGYPWYACRICGEVQQRKQTRSPGPCVMTPGCKGRMALYLVCRCEGCGEPLTGRSRDGRFCRAACRKVET